MSWSLSEIESLARKAARGAGLTWGIAEEAGKATRWLCAADLPGTEALAGLLQRNDGMDYADLCPVDGAGPELSARSGPLCPLVAGAVLCDQAQEIADGKHLILKEVSYPILLIPYVVIAADMTKSKLSLRWSGAELTRSADGTYLQANDAALRTGAASNVEIGLSTGHPGQRIERAYRGQIADDIADILNRFAHRTYAPETPERRMAGAGAGLTDND